MSPRDFDRRRWLQLSLASTWGWSVSGWLPKLARAGQQAQTAKSCILLWMSGGPSQIDTFDPKPRHDNGGDVEAIATAVPGIHISEFLPQVAQQIRDMAIIRDMNTGEGDHGRGSQLMLTGYKPNPAIAYPSLGSLLAKELGSLDNELPNYVSLASGQRFGQVGGAGFLGPRYAPLIVSGTSNDPAARANLTIENLAPPVGVTADAMKKRFATLQILQSEFGQSYRSMAAEAHRANAERAARMIESQAKHAFRLDEENKAIRDAYGRNQVWAGLSAGTPAGRAWRTVCRGRIGWNGKQQHSGVGYTRRKPRPRRPVVRGTGFSLGNLDQRSAATRLVGVHVDYLDGRIWPHAVDQ